MFELLTEPESAPRGELVTYASKSATRCSSDGTVCNAAALRPGAGEGDGGSANSEDTHAMIPVSNKTRSITRVRYRHASFRRQEKWRRNFQPR